MFYESTRGLDNKVSVETAVVRGIANDGGLFVPSEFPKFTTDQLQDLLPLTYQERAKRILKLFLTSFTEDEIASCIEASYNEQSFDSSKIAPIVKLEKGLYIHELWHGPTCAFKDMALQLLPNLLTVSAKKLGVKEEIVILVATSGDTGKAALEGFCNVNGTRVVVFYPEDGVSQVQRQQMITQTGKNVNVIAVKGNFDDTQNGVKEIFSDRAFAGQLLEKNMVLSSANSINWGRLLPQVIYYISAYLDLVSSGEIQFADSINIAVPTGNFGNILAAYYSLKMGVPIKSLICASNANNVLTDFISTGRYDRNRHFVTTISPSMDILISSNLERLLYELSNHNGETVSDYMGELRENGVYEVSAEIKEQISKLFFSAYADDNMTKQEIFDFWNKHNYLLDTHTAVAMCAYNSYIAKTDDSTPTLIASTANPFKFASSVAEALGGISTCEDEFRLLVALSEKTGISIPKGLTDLDKRHVLHTTVCEKNEMKSTLSEYLFK